MTNTCSTYFQYSPFASSCKEIGYSINHNHDNCQIQHLPDTVLIDSSMEELVISIPLDVEEENEKSVNYATDDTIIQPQPFNDNPEEIEFPLEYFTNAEQNVTSSDNDTEQDDYVIETEQNPTPHIVEYPIVNYERDIDL